MEWDQVKFVSGANWTNTTATFLNITGLSFTGDINSKYDIELVICGQGSTINGVRFDINFSAAGAGGTLSGLASSASNAVDILGFTVGTASSTSSWTTANTDMCVYFKGAVTTGSSSGTFTVRGSKTSSGTLTVYTGSVLKIRKIA